jgi:tRNA nucleotidyltransferase/poly(A) polymerase
MFEVGGCVRDELLGQPSKDIDFTVVMEDYDILAAELSSRPLYDVMVSNLESMGVKIFRDNDGKPVGADYFTARGKAPKDFPVHPNRPLDFVLARKEGEYTDGRRPDKVEVGTLMDDLARRDFTMNAIAKDVDGNLIDPFNGVQAIEERCIYAVGNPQDRFSEDALRAVRALRFSVTKGFIIAEGVKFAMETQSVLDSIVENISAERIEQELSKMFRLDTVASLRALSEFPRLTEALFAGRVSLDATLKEKGRGGNAPARPSPEYFGVRDIYS